MTINIALKYISSLSFFILFHLQKFIESQKADAYVIVYSVEDRESFESAVDRLYEVRKDNAQDVAVILVANKLDLVRTRVVLEDGKASL